MDKYVFGRLLPIVISGILLALGLVLPTLLAKYGKKTRLPETSESLPASTTAYVISTALAGSLAALCFFLLNKVNPGEQVFEWGGFYLFCSILLYWIGRSMESGKRADLNRTLWVIFVPFVAGMWLAAGALSLFAY